MLKVRAAKPEFKILCTTQHRALCDPTRVMRSYFVSHVVTRASCSLTFMCPSTRRCTFLLPHSLKLPQPHGHDERLLTTRQSGRARCQELETTSGTISRGMRTRYHPLQPWNYQRIACKMNKPPLPRKMQQVPTLDSSSFGDNDDVNPARAD